MPEIKLIHIILGMIVMTKLMLVYYLNIWWKSRHTFHTTRKPYNEYQFLFRVVQLDDLKRLCNPFLAEHRSYYAQVIPGRCLSSLLRGNIEWWRFHSLSQQSIPLLDISNVHKSEDIQRCWKAARCLPLLTNRIYYLPNCDDLGIYDLDFYLLHVHRFIY